MTAQDHRPDGCAAEPGAPSGAGFIALLAALRASGGTAPAGILARLLDERRSGPALGLAQAIHTGQVFGFAWRASLWIPMFQFNACDLAVKPAAQQVRMALPAHWTGWNLAAWFATAHAHLGGRCPADLLDTDTTAVLRAARLQPTAARVPSPAPLPARRAPALAAHG